MKRWLEPIARIKLRARLGRAWLLRRNLPVLEGVLACEAAEGLRHLRGHLRRALRDCAECNAITIVILRS